MREVIHIQGGGCGNKISANYWETITAEHQLTPSGIYEGNLELELDKHIFQRRVSFSLFPTSYSLRYRTNYN